MSLRNLGEKSNLSRLREFSHRLLQNHLGSKALSAARLRKLVVSVLVHVVVQLSLLRSRRCCGHEKQKKKDVYKYFEEKKEVRKCLEKNFDTGE